MIKTKVCDLLDIEYPIIQGGMAWVATAELAAAVSNAGGLGIIGSGNAPVEVVQEEIKKIKGLTDKPFGVNIMLLSPFATEIIDLVCKEKVPVITTGAGNPGKYIPKLKKQGIKIIPVVPSVALAKKMEQIGADAVIAEGTEAGGHIGELTTMVLVPQVADAVNIPVIAAGGIGDARGLIAALSLGAQGVQMGTIFICSKECKVHNNYKEAIIKSGDRGTGVTGRTTGHPVRIIKNKLYKEFNKLEKSGASIEEIEQLGKGKLKLACMEGDIVTGSVMAGQISGLIKEVKTVREIIETIMMECDSVINRINNLARGENLD